MTEKKKTKTDKSLILSLIFLVLSGILVFASRKLPGFAPFYSTHIYPLWQGSLGRFSGIFPFSLSEILLYGLPVFLLMDFVIGIRKLGIKGSLRFLKHFLFAASLLLLIYELNCGINYFNTSFSQSEGIEKVPVNKALLEEFLRYTADELSGFDEVSGNYPTGSDLSKESVAAMKNLGEIYPSLSGYYPRPKGIFISRPFSNMGVTGIYSPLFIEANYNREMPGFNLPFTSCHELSHLKGYMNEGEANFIGWLACINSKNLSYKRSGHIISWIYAGNVLYKLDKELYRSIRDTLPEEVLDELSRDNEFWKTHKTKASDVQDKVNDSYLKGSGVEEGIESYGELVDFMLAWYNTNVN